MHTCNCEHLKHFPVDESEPIEWADIPRTGHKYMEQFITDNPQTEMYVGIICLDCFVNCFGNNINERIR